MSKGQPIVSARLPIELYVQFMEQLDRRNSNPWNVHWSIADALVNAVIEWVHHGKRAKKGGGKRPVSTEPDPGDRRTIETPEGSSGQKNPCRGENCDCNLSDGRADAGPIHEYLGEVTDETN